LLELKDFSVQHSKVLTESSSSFLSFSFSASQSATMKLSILTALSSIALVAGFAPSVPMQKASTALNAEPVEQSRKAFLSAAALTVFGAAIVTPVMAMDQVLVTDPTEQWETGSPTPAAAKARSEMVARTQLTSNFAPIKRLTLERKSPVVRHYESNGVICFRLSCHSKFLHDTDFVSITSLIFSQFADPFGYQCSWLLRLQEDHAWSLQVNSRLQHCQETYKFESRNTINLVLVQLSIV
jgi:hypothetical protein